MLFVQFQFCLLNLIFGNHLNNFVQSCRHLIAFLIGNFGSTMKKIIEKKLITVSIIASIILVIFAFFVYNFLMKFTA